MIRPGVEFVCFSCGARKDPLVANWQCDCGGVWDVVVPADQTEPDGRGALPFSLWRFGHLLPFLPEAADRVTLGEGMTPLIAVQWDAGHVILKLESQEPSLSFKDRGAVMVVLHGLVRGADRLVVDSSGNAGLAIATYAARAGLGCTVFVPERVSPLKAAAISSTGAEVRKVDGAREEVAAAAIASLDEGGDYASHVYNPLFLEGVKTMALEIFEQLGGRAPERIVVPVGNGTLLLGLYRGFQLLCDLGRLDTVPQITGVQAAACAPLAAAFAAGRHSIDPVEGAGTVAAGIAIGAPPRAAQILTAVHRSGGTVLTVTEEDIALAHRQLARSGLATDPAAAAALAALSQLDANPGPTIGVVSGWGMVND